MNRTHLNFIRMQNQHLNYQLLKEAGARMDEILKSNKTPRMNQMDDLLNPGKNNLVKEDNRKCNHCGKTGHPEKRCWSKYPELRPKREANPEKSSETKTGVNTNSARAECDFCGRPGHALITCRKLEKFSQKARQEVAYQQSLYCQLCRRNGHSTEYCRNREHPSNESLPSTSGMQA